MIVVHHLQTSSCPKICVLSAQCLCTLDITNLVLWISSTMLPLSAHTNPVLNHRCCLVMMSLQTQPAAFKVSSKSDDLNASLQMQRTDPNWGQCCLHRLAPHVKLLWTQLVYANCFTAAWHDTSKAPLMQQVLLGADDRAHHVALGKRDRCELQRICGCDIYVGAMYMRCSMYAMYLGAMYMRCSVYLGAMYEEMQRISRCNICVGAGMRRSSMKLSRSANARSKLTRKLLQVCLCCALTVLHRSSILSLFRSFPHLLHSAS